MKNKQVITCGAEPHMGSVDQWLEDAFDSIDCAVFSSDALQNKDGLSYFDHFVSRWQRGLASARQQVDIENSVESARAAIAAGVTPELHAIMVRRNDASGFYLEVYATDKEAKESFFNYSVFEVPKHSALFYLKCQSYIAPGFYKGRPINVVNRDDESPDIGFPESMILIDDVCTHEGALFGVVFHNHESNMLALAVYAKKAEAQDFYISNRLQPVIMTQTVMPGRCAVAVFLGHDVDLFPKEFDGKLIEIINEQDVTLVTD